MGTNVLRVGITFVHKEILSPVVNRVGFLVFYRNISWVLRSRVLSLKTIDSALEYVQLNILKDIFSDTTLLILLVNVYS